VTKRPSHREGKGVGSMKQNEVFAAIALALHEHLGNNVHDVEPGIITIAEHPTQWNGYAQTMTAHP